MRVIIGYIYPQENKLLSTFIHTHALIENVVDSFESKLSPRYFRTKQALLPFSEEKNRASFSLYERQNVQLVVRFHLTENAPPDYKKLVATNGKGPLPVHIMDQMKYFFFEEGFEGYFTRYCDSHSGLPNRIDFIDFDLGNMEDKKDMLLIGNGKRFGEVVGIMFNKCAQYLLNGALVDAKTFPFPNSRDY